MARVDPDGEIWNNVIGAILGGVVEYGSQVAANAVTNGGLNLGSFVEGIDIADVGLACVEGALTSGSSAIKSVAVKAVIKVGTEVIQNVVNVNTTSDGVNASVNSVEDVVVQTAVGVATHSFKTKAKVNISSTQSANKAVYKARQSAHSQGKGLNCNEARSIAVGQRSKNVHVGQINKTISDNVNSAVGNTTGTVIKQNINDEKEL